MGVYFAHNGVDDGHPNVYTNTIDTTVPGPADPKPHINYVFIGSASLIVLIVLQVVGDFVHKKFRKPKAPAAPEKDASQAVEPTKTPLQSYRHNGCVC